MRTTLTFEGNVTDNVQLRQTQQGKPFVTFSIAHNDRRFNAQTNQWEDGVTTFLNCSAFGALAQNISQSIGKGCRVVAVGTLQQHNFTDKQGANRSTMELTCDTVAVDLRNQTAQVYRPQASQNPAQAYATPQAAPQQQAAPAQQFAPNTPAPTQPATNYQPQQQQAAQPAANEGWVAEW